MSIENWPARREVREYTVTDATGWMQPWPLNLPAKMVPASDYKALEARLRGTAEALEERQDTIDWIFACFPALTEVLTPEQIESTGLGGTTAREILAQLKEEGLT
jgi:hypothetical protein